MNTPNAVQSVSNADVERQLFDVPPETMHLVSLGRAHRWDFRVLGKAPLPMEPVRLGDWLLVPAQQDSTPIPQRAMARIQAIFAAGIRPTGFVLVHEAPKLLKAPVVTPERTPGQFAEGNGITSVPQSSSDFLTTLGTGMSALASMIFPMFLFVVAAAMADPILVAVTEDNYWIEIDRWYTE